MLVLITVLNVIGLGVGKWLNNLGAVGMALPVLILDRAGRAVVLTLWLGHPFQLGGRRSPCSGERPHFLVDDFFRFQRLRMRFVYGG